MCLLRPRLPRMKFVVTVSDGHRRTTALRVKWFGESKVTSRARRRFA